MPVNTIERLRCPRGSGDGSPSRESLHTCPSRAAGGIADQVAYRAAGLQGTAGRLVAAATTFFLLTACGGPSDLGKGVDHREAPTPAGPQPGLVQIGSLSVHPVIGPSNPGDVVGEALCRIHGGGEAGADVVYPLISRTVRVGSKDQAHLLVPGLLQGSGVVTVLDIDQEQGATCIPITKSDRDEILNKIRSYLTEEARDALKVTEDLLSKRRPGNQVIVDDPTRYCRWNEVLRNDAILQVAGLYCVIPSHPKDLTLLTSITYNPILPITGSRGLPLKQQEDVEVIRHPSLPPTPSPQLPFVSCRGDIGAYGICSVGCADEIYKNRLRDRNFPGVWVEYGGGCRSILNSAKGNFTVTIPDERLGGTWSAVRIMQTDPNHIPGANVVTHHGLTLDGHQFEISVGPKGKVYEMKFEPLNKGKPGDLVRLFFRADKNGTPGGTCESLVVGLNDAYEHNRWECESPRYQSLSN